MAGECSACGGVLEELGLLGNRMYYYCRNCGAEISKRVDPEGLKQLDQEDKTEDE